MVVYIFDIVGYYEKLEIRGYSILQRSIGWLYIHIRDPFINLSSSFVENEEA